MLITNILLYFIVGGIIAQPSIANTNTKTRIVALSFVLWPIFMILALFIDE